jgi:uncharacterized protein (TIGR03382 family)
MWHAVGRLRRETLAAFPVPDVALAVALCAIAVASVLTGNPNEGPAPLTLPVAVALTAALLWRRRSPLVCVAIIIVAGTAQTVLSQTPGSLWSLAVYAIAMYSLAAYCSEGAAAVAGAVFVGALLVQERIDNGVDYVFVLLLFGGLWLLGRLSRYWRGRVSTAEQRQHETARLAVAEERVRIARELHDIVAHSLSVIAVQSDAAEAALAVAPGRALAPVQTIRSTARSALGEIRRMLDVLRTDDDDLRRGIARHHRHRGACADDQVGGLARRARRATHRRPGSAGGRPGQLPNRAGVPDERAQACQRGGCHGHGRARTRATHASRAERPM